MWMMASSVLTADLQSTKQTAKRAGTTSVLDSDHFDLHIRDRHDCALLTQHYSPPHSRS
jgi:hypothetical protein